MTGVASTSTTFPGGGSFTVDGVHSDYFGMYYSAWSYDPIPSIRSGMVDLAGRRGKRDNGSELSSRLLTMDLRSVAHLSTDRWKYLHRWASAMNPETGPHAIEFVDENPGWVIYVQPAGGSASPQLVMTEWTQSFEAADPHWYSQVTPVPVQSLTSVPGQPAGFGTFVNTGNTFIEPVWYIAPSAAGQVLTNPLFQIGSQRCQLFGQISYGENWNVDVATKTVTRNGITDIANWTGTFPVLPGSQAGYDAGGLGTLVEIVDQAQAGMYIQAALRARLL